MANYVPKGSKSKKDPDAPKKALSPFFWFCADERPKVKAEQPDIKFGEVAKELGVRWKGLSNDSKKKYEALALKDKQRYERENAAYGSKKGGKGSKKQQVESDEDED